MINNMEMAEGRLGRVVAVRLKPGTDVLLGLTEACRNYNIKNGVILSAIGSLDGVRYCDIVELPDKAAGCGYGEVLHLSGLIELTSATGIICHEAETGEINLHIQITLSDRYGNGYGGHLVEGTLVKMTVDVVMAEIEGIRMERQWNEELEVPLFAPKQG